jgi:hypothetical protein
VASHIVIGRDSFNGVHVYQFATAHQASEFVRQVESMDGVAWSRYEIASTSVREALLSIKKWEAVCASET